MLWLKAFHVIFVITWFAGLFYLPRLFVYHTQVTDTASQERFELMERKLYGIMTLGGLLALIFGLALLYFWATRVDGYFSQGWLHVKLTSIALLVGYHLYCKKLMNELKQGRGKSHVWYRWFNEGPAVLLLLIVIMVVVKPF